MTEQLRSPRGAAAVAMLQELPNAEVLLVRSLRLWCEGEPGQRQLERDFALSLGEACGARAYQQVDAVLRLMLENCRRPLIRHAASCRCVGSDEAVFAQLVTSAASGEREDAMMVACLLVRADIAPSLCAAAEGLGVELLRGGLRSPVTPHAASPTLH